MGVTARLRRPIFPLDQEDQEAVHEEEERTESRDDN